jgi:hypothetical protein
MPFDNVLEAEPNNEQAKATAAPNGQPIALNGILETPGDVDYFKVPLKKGMKLDVMGYAQTLARRSIRSSTSTTRKVGRSEAMTTEAAAAVSTASSRSTFRRTASILSAS